MIQNDCIVPDIFLSALQKGGTMAARRSHTRKDPDGHVLRKGEGYRKTNSGISSSTRTMTDIM